jgi:biotin transport system substrate-specific component
VSLALAPSLVITPRVPARVRDAALVTAGTGLIVLSAQFSVPLPFTPVPLTGQTAGFLLAGGALGLHRGLAAAMLYLVVGAVGAPVFAGGSGGAAVLGSPTGGYLVGMLVAAGLTGAAADRGWDRSYARSLAAVLVPSAVIYLLGASWLAVSLGVDAERAWQLGVQPFLLGDAVKVGLVSAVLPTCWRLLGRGGATTGTNGR